MSCWGCNLPKCMTTWLGSFELQYRGVPNCKVLRHLVISSGLFGRVSSTSDSDVARELLAKWL
jgi:hypothetical protein